MISENTKEFFLEKRKSKIDGFGIFTKEFIDSRKVFYVVPTEKVSDTPTKKLAKIGNNKYVDDIAVLNWVNHSCNANTKLEIERQPRLVAIRNIEANEEITCDYDETEINGNKIVCTCGDKKCRGFFLRVS